jgi:hypothetical protein
MSGIKAGDLVMVVRPMPCCGNARSIGKVFEVRRVTRDLARCPHCKTEFEETYANAVNGRGWEVPRLIRIDPPALPESIDAEREVTA